MSLYSLNFEYKFHGKQSYKVNFGVKSIQKYDIKYIRVCQYAYVGKFVANAARQKTLYATISFM